MKLRPYLLIAIGLCLAPLSAQAQFKTAPRQEPPPSEPVIAPVPPGVPTTPDNVHLPTETEIKLGRRSAAEVERELKVISSGPYYDRVQRVSRVVVAAIQRQDIIDEYKRVYKLPRKGDDSRRVPFEFTFKVVDVPDPNAFALAGGPIYVTKGLLDFTPSDHELASVLAHECAHSMFHHVEQMTRKAKKFQTTQLLTFIAAMAAAIAGGPGAGNVIPAVLAGNLVQTAALTGYGRDLEAEADRIGVMALKGTGYNPVGMLTFMQKLAREYSLRGNPDVGIYGSHPYPNERVTAIKAGLEKAGYRTDTGEQRKVGGGFKVVLVPVKWQGRDATELRLNDTLLFTVVDGEGELGQSQRARTIADRIDSLVQQGDLSDNDVRRNADRSVLTVKGVPVIKPYYLDAAVLGGKEAVVDQAYKAFIKAFWKERLDTTH